MQIIETESKGKLVEFGRGGYAAELRVVWNVPTEAKNFVFPRIEIVVLSKYSGSLKPYLQRTEPAETYESLMVHAVSMALHPMMREFVAREVFDQFRAVTSRKVYVEALANWKLMNKKASPFNGVNNKDKGDDK